MKVNVIIRANLTMIFAISAIIVFLTFYGLMLSARSLSMVYRIYYGIPSLFIGVLVTRFILVMTIFRGSLLAEKGGNLIGPYVKKINIKDFATVSVRRVGVSEMFSFERLEILLKNGKIRSIPMFLVSGSALEVTDNLKKFVEMYSDNSSVR